MPATEQIRKKVGDLPHKPGVYLMRDKLGREVAEMKKRLDWGLVFERHLPENVRALSAPIKPGSVVWERRTTTPRRLRVRSVDGADLIVVPEPEKGS